LLGPPTEELASADEERAYSELGQIRKRCVYLTFGAGIQDMDLQSERVRRLLHITHLGLSSWVGWVREQADKRCCWYQIVQQSQSFRHQLGAQLGHAGAFADQGFSGSWSG
jgi:hypothetical protein